MQSIQSPKFQLRSVLCQLLAVLAICCVSHTRPSYAQSAFRPPPRPQAETSTTKAPPTTSPVAQPNAAPAIAPPAASIGAPVTPPQSQVNTPITPTESLSAQPIEGGEIVARIDGQVVLASDVLWQVNQLIKANSDRIPPDKIEEAKRALMRQQVMALIDTKIIFANFRRQVPAENIPTITDSLAKPFHEQEVPRLVKMLGLGSRNELETLLRESGTTLSDVQRQFNERTIAGEWLRQLMDKPKEVTHDDMLDYYTEHKQEFEFPSQAKWEEVVIRFDRMGNDRTAAWEGITGIGNEVWQRVVKSPGLRGPVFTEIAKQRSHGYTASDGGAHDWTTKGALRSKEIDEALFALKVGQLSNIIESEQGFHIVRVLDRKEAGCTPFTEAQADIRTKLEQAQRKGLAETAVGKLRKKSRVWTVFDGDISAEQLAPQTKAAQRR